MKLLELCPDILETIIDHLFKARARINLELYKTIVKHYNFTRRFRYKVEWDQDANEKMFCPYYSRPYYYVPRYRLIHWSMPRKALINALIDNNLDKSLIISRSNRQFITRWLLNNNVFWAKS